MRSIFSISAALIAALALPLACTSTAPREGGLRTPDGEIPKPSPLAQAVPAGDAALDEQLASAKRDLQEMQGKLLLDVMDMESASAKPLVRQLLAGGVRPDVATPEGVQPIHAMAAHGDIELAKILLAAGANVGAQTKDGRQPLHFCAQNGRIEMARHLLSAGAGVDAVDGNGALPIHHAALEGQTEMVRFLIASGSKADAATPKAGMQPIHLAALNGYTETVKALLAAGARADAKSRIGGAQPVFFAALGGHAKTVEFLLSAGAPKSAMAGADGKTPESLAAENGFPELAQAYRATRAAKTELASKPDALVAAASHNGTEDVRHLLAAGADPNLADAHGSTALVYAATWGNADIVKNLLLAGAKADRADRVRNQAIHSAASPEVVGALVAAGADPNARAIDGWCPLHNTALRGKMEVAESLVAAGARASNRSLTDSEGFPAGTTPGEMARKSGFAELADYLDGQAAQEIRWGTPEAKQKALRDALGRHGSLPRAAADGDMEGVKTLLSLGEKIGAADERGWQPIHLAAINGHADVVRFLIASRAKADAADARGWQPIHMAAFHGDVQTVKVLLAAEAKASAKTAGGATPSVLARAGKHEELAAFLDGEAKRESKDAIYFLAEKLSADGAWPAGWRGGRRMTNGIMPIPDLPGAATLEDVGADILRVRTFSVQEAERRFIPSRMAVAQVKIIRIIAARKVAITEHHRVVQPPAATGAAKEMPTLCVDDIDPEPFVKLNWRVKDETRDGQCMAFLVATTLGKKIILVWYEGKMDRWESRVFDAGDLPRDTKPWGAVLVGPDR